MSAAPCRPLGLVAAAVMSLAVLGSLGHLHSRHDRKSDVPVILYAEFTAKPGSESQVQMLISDLPRRCAGAWQY